MSIRFLKSEYAKKTSELKTQKTILVQFDVIIVIFVWPIENAFFLSIFCIMK